MGTSMREGGNGGLRAGESGEPSTRGSEAAQARGESRRGRGEPEGLATLLAWFSIGLGLAQLVAPERLARLVGARGGSDSRTLMRALGARELASGIGILSRPGSSAWLWGRVAGDAMDLALLGNLLASGGRERTRTLGATAAVLGVAALDLAAARQLQRDERAEAGEETKPGAIQTRRSITVGRPVEEVYEFWRDLENLPRFMRNLVSVEVTGDRTSHWVARAPGGKTVEWDAETVEDVPNELIAWRSLEGADVYNEGSVRFQPAPGGRGTEVRVELTYEPPGGVIVSKLASLLRREPGQQVADDLRRFKQVMETGDIVLSDATLFGRPHPGQPPDELPAEIERRSFAPAPGRPADVASDEAARTTSSEEWSGPVSATEAGSTEGISRRARRGRGERDLRG
jgi:uncharacterized membrane protein